MLFSDVVWIQFSLCASLQIFKSYVSANLSSAPEDMAKGKLNKALWLVSNCGVKERIDYVKHLQELGLEVNS